MATFSEKLTALGNEAIKAAKGDKLFRFNSYDKDTVWNQEDFLSKDNTLSDIFYCIEAGRYFCPGRNELFVFEHPDLEMPEDPLAEDNHSEHK